MAPRTRGSADPHVRAGLAAEEEKRHYMRDASRSDRPLETEGSNRLLRAGRREDDGISGANRDLEQGEAAREHSAGKETGSSAIHNVHQPPKQASSPCRLACGGVRPHPGPRLARSETARGGEKYRTRVFRRFRTLPPNKKTTETRARKVAWRPLKRREVTGVRDRARRTRARDAHARARGFVAEASRRRDSRDATRLDYFILAAESPLGSM